MLRWHALNRTKGHGPPMLRWRALNRTKGHGNFGKMRGRKGSQTQAETLSRHKESRKIMATLSPSKRTSTDSAGLPDPRGLRNKKHCVGEEEEKKTCEVFVVNKGSSNGHIFSIARSGLHKIVLEGKTLTCELQDVDSVTPRLWVTVYPSQPDVALLDPKVVEAERKEYTRVLNELTIALDNTVAALLKALREVAVNNVTNAEITGLNCEVALLSQKLGAHKDLQTLPCSVIKS